MQKWEYRVLRIDALSDDEIRECEDKLCRYGDDGWELVAVHPRYGSLHLKEVMPCVSFEPYIFILKRQTS
jgi:hypothetical protein